MAPEIHCYPNPASRCLDRQLQLYVVLHPLILNIMICTVMSTLKKNLKALIKRIVTSVKSWSFKRDWSRTSTRRTSSERYTVPLWALQIRYCYMCAGYITKTCHQQSIQWAVYRISPILPGGWSYNAEQNLICILNYFYDLHLSSTNFKIMNEQLWKQ